MKKDVVVAAVHEEPHVKVREHASTLWGIYCNNSNYPT